MIRLNEGAKEEKTESKLNENTPDELLLLTLYIWWLQKWLIT